MENHSLIFLGPLEGPLLEAQQLLDKDPEFTVKVISAENFSKEFKVEWFPCVILSSSIHDTLKFQNFFRAPFKKTASKFILACPEELNSKKEKVIYGLNVSDVLSGPLVKAKTITHKAKLLFRTLPKLDEEDKGAIKFKHLKAKEQEKSTIEQKSEINYETIDFRAMIKFCDSSLRNLNNLEELLENYEEAPNNDLVLSINEAFTDFKDEASKNSLDNIASFIKITSYLTDKLPECEDVLASVVTGILFNSVDFLRAEVKSIKEKKARRQILDNPHKGIFDRYRWISEKFVNEKGDTSINEMMDELGI